MKNRLTSGFPPTFFQQRGLIVRRIAVLAGALTTSICFAAAGDLDPTFATNGLYYFPDHIASQSSGYFHNESTRQVIPLSRGGYLALGGLNSGPTGSARYGPSPSFALTSSGVLDAAFGQSGWLPGPSAKGVYGQDAAYRYVAARELADGRLLLASEVVDKCASPSGCGLINPGLSYNVERYLPNGSVDSSYGVAGAYFVELHQGNAAILSDGTAIALGQTWYPLPITGAIQYYGASADAIVIDAGGHANAVLATRFRSQMLRCNPSGTTEMTGAVQPVVEATPGDQVIYAYGSCMLKLNRDGTPDASFGTGGMSQLDNDGLTLTRVLLRKDGSILTFSLLADGSSYRVTKRLANGAPDSSFGAAGVMAKMSLPFAPILLYQFDGPQPFTTSLPNSRGLPALDAEERVLVAGFIADSGPNKQSNYIARFDSQLRLDTSFGSLGSGLAPVGNADLGLFVPLSVAVDSSQRMVFAGYLQVPNPKIPQNFAYSSALIRMQADAPASAAGAGSGGCGTVGNARFDPTLWLLAALAMMALALSQRRRSMLPALNDIAIQG